MELNTNTLNNFNNNINVGNNCLSLLEKAKFERDHAINALNNYYNKYQKESEDLRNIKENYSSMEQNLYETQEKYKVIENKLTENIEELLQTERKLNSVNNKNEVLMKENTIIKNHLLYFLKMLLII